MLSDAVINLITIIIDLLPEADIGVYQVPAVVTNIVNVCWFFLPMDTIGMLFGISVAITIFRITFALIIRIKSFIPTMGA